jgi:hypothetical protein
MPTGVEFEEDTFGVKRPNPQATTSSGQYSYAAADNASNSNESAMIRWLMKKGIVKSHAAGQAILVGILVLNIIVTFIVIKFFT